MASPVGHALAGLAAAAVVQQVTGAPNSPLLWIGAFVAAGVPDLDLIWSLMGRKGPAYHRNASHSIITAGGALVLGWFAFLWSPLHVPSSVFVAWSASLLTHAPLDYLTTGPRLAAAGYGVSLFWPWSQKRYFSKRPWLASDRPETERSWDLVSQALEELVRIGPIALTAVLIARGLF